MTTARKRVAFVVSTKREVANYGRGGGEEKVVGLGAHPSHK